MRSVMGLSLHWRVEKNKVSDVPDTNESEYWSSATTSELENVGPSAPNPPRCSNDDKAKDLNALQTRMEFHLPNQTWRALANGKRLVLDCGLGDKAQDGLAHGGPATTRFACNDHQPSTSVGSTELGKRGLFPSLRAHECSVWRKKWRFLAPISQHTFFSRSLGFSSRPPRGGDPTDLDDRDSSLQVKKSYQAPDQNKLLYTSALLSFPGSCCRISDWLFYKEPHDLVRAVMLQRTLTHNSCTAAVASWFRKPIVNLTFLARRKVHGHSQELQQLGIVFSQALRVCQATA